MPHKIVSRDYSHKLDIFFAIPLCEEDVAMIERNCQRLRFNPKPRAVGRALFRCAGDMVEQGRITIHSIYETYNASAISVARTRPDNPVTELISLNLTDEEEETLARFRAVNGMSWEEVIKDFVSMALYFAKRCDYKRVDWEPAEAREQQRA